MNEIKQYSNGELKRFIAHKLDNLNNLKEKDVILSQNEFSMLNYAIERIEKGKRIIVKEEFKYIGKIKNKIVYIRKDIVIIKNKERGIYRDSKGHFASIKRK